MQFLFSFPHEMGTSAQIPEQNRVPVESFITSLGIRPSTSGIQLNNHATANQTNFISFPHCLCQ